MRYSIQELSEITDSRELLESKPYPFTVIFIYILIFILILTLGWCYFSEKEIVVKANGTVRPNKDINRIINKSVGKVECINIKNGEKVKIGQTLYIVEHSSLDIEKSAIDKDIQATTKELDNLKKLSKSILENKNCFTKDNEEEKIFYDKYVKYEANYKAESSQAKNAQAQIQNINDNLRNLELLKQSLESETNCLDSNNAYYNQFLDYEVNVKQYQSKVNQAQKNYDQQNKLGQYVAANDIANAKVEFENAKDELQKYKNQYLLNIKNNIEQNNEKLKGLQEIPVDKYAVNEITEINDAIKVNENNINKLNDTLKNININIEDCIVKSPANGVINVITQINKGDLIQGGIEIATIIPYDKSDYKVQMYMSNKDIANIKEGQKIKYHFTALPYQDYGYLNGVITKVGVDSIVDGKSGLSFYNVEASVENKALYNQKKEKGEIKVGMSCEAQIITRKKKILYYLLEKLNLKN